MEQMTFICDMVGQIMQKKEEERRITEDQAVKDDIGRFPFAMMMTRTIAICNHKKYDSLEEENYDQEEKKFDLEDIFQIQDVILHEKLLNVHHLITIIESLKNNPTPDHVFKFPSLVPISVTDSGSFFEVEPDLGGLTSVVISDNSNDPLLELPEFESFHFDLDPSFPRPPPEPPDVKISLIVEPDVPAINNFDELNEDECFDPWGDEIDVEDDDSFTFVTWIFLPFLTYP
ncbi:hypothetical protein Tco_0945353 [Tanacetum coccineum]